VVLWISFILYIYKYFGLFYTYSMLQILADRGFTLQEDFALLGASLITPEFTKGRKQLSGREVEESRVKSNVQVHIGKFTIPCMIQLINV